MLSSLLYFQNPVESVWANNGTRKNNLKDYRWQILQIANI